MKYGSKCKELRISLNIRLIDLCDKFNYKNLWAFENGKSQNIQHLNVYLVLAKRNNCLNYFINSIIEGIENGG